MNFGSIQKFSIIDYPNELTAVLFTIGCNLRCPYCHNPELIYGTNTSIGEEEVLNFLKKRQGKLTAVSITGGEPSIHRKELFEFLEKVKLLGFKIKIDTNGTNPIFLKEVIKNNLIDYIAMDIKANIERYESVVKVDIDKRSIEKSIETIMESNLDYEFRTTVVKSFVGLTDVRKIAKKIKGSKLYCIQNFIPSKTFDKNFLNMSGFDQDQLREMCETAKQFVKSCIIRG